MAGDRASKRQGDARLDWQRLLSLALATLLLVLGLFCAWQAWLIVHEQDVVQRVQGARDRAASALAAEIASELSPVEQVIGRMDPAAAMSAPERAAATLRQQLPQATQVELYSGSLDEVLHANYRVFGYAKAAQLMAAIGAHGVPLAQSVTDGNGERRLSFVVPLGKPPQAQGWVWVELPFTRLQQRFNALPTGGGRLDLRQAGPQGDLRLLAHGEPTTTAERVGKAVAGSVFNIGAALPRAFIVLPTAPAPAALLA